MLALAFPAAAAGWLLLYSGFKGVDPREEFAAAFRGGHASPRNPASGSATPGTLPAGNPGVGGADKGKIIGTPGAGTHSFSAPPDNWESDNAVDISLPYGTPIVACSAGYIGPKFGPLGSGDSRFAGLRLHLHDNPNGREFYYAHLSKTVVLPGMRVKVGDLLGYSGAANGVNHLHFAVNKPFDPRSFAEATYR